MTTEQGGYYSEEDGNYYHQFPTGAVQGALQAASEAAAEQLQQVQGAVAAADVTTLDLTTAHISEVTLQAACIDLAIRNGKVCLSLPLGLGSICLPIPIPIPDGTAASACISIRTWWGLPTGACVSVSALGNEIVRQCFP